MRVHLLIAPLALLAACAPQSATPPHASAASQSVEITATYRERIRLPDDHVLTVRVADVSLADAPSVTLAEVSQRLDGRSPPFKVALNVPSASIQSRHTYAAQAEIRDPSGRLVFVTDTHTPVLTHGGTHQAQILLKAVP